MVVNFSVDEIMIGRFEVGFCEIGLTAGFVDWVGSGRLDVDDAAVEL